MYVELTESIKSKKQRKDYKDRFIKHEIYFVTSSKCDRPEGM